MELTYEIIQRIEVGKGPVPMLRKQVKNLESLVYQGPECVSLEQAVSLGVAAYRDQVAPATVRKNQKVEPNRCEGRGLPGGKYE
jgi:hypothetical protein